MHESKEDDQKAELVEKVLQAEDGREEQGECGKSYWRGVSSEGGLQGTRKVALRRKFCTVGEENRQGEALAGTILQRGKGASGALPLRCGAEI